MNVSYKPTKSPLKILQQEACFPERDTGKIPFSGLFFQIEWYEESFIGLTGRKSMCPNIVLENKLIGQQLPRRTEGSLPNSRHKIGSSAFCSMLQISSASVRESIIPPAKHTACARIFDRRPVCVIKGESTPKMVGRQKSVFQLLFSFCAVNLVCFVIKKLPKKQRCEGNVAPRWQNRVCSHKTSQSASFAITTRDVASRFRSPSTQDKIAQI